MISEPTSPLEFRCTSCGNCCRSLRVAVTALDVARLVRATSRPALDLVEFLTPEAVDMTGEPDGFIDLREGRRLMVLAQENAACRLLGKDNRCLVYSARPRDCQAFPFDFGLPSTPADARHLTLLPLAGCEYESGEHHDAHQLLATDTARWSELCAYKSFVARWNRRARHQRRLGHPVGSSALFIAKALASVAEPTPAAPS
jgi:Fe-S-cluster containining protein